MSRPNVKKLLFEQFARVGKALGSGHRLELLELLAQGERSVEALAAAAHLPVVNSSQHLQQLRRAGLVNTRKQGLCVYYTGYRIRPWRNCSRRWSKSARSCRPKWTGWRMAI